MRKATINSRHAQDEIIANINNGDAIKARLVLNQFSGLESGVQRRILYELNRHSSGPLRLSLLCYLAARDPEAKKHYPEIEEAILDTVMNAPDQLLALVAISAPEQAYCIELACKLRFQAAVPALIGLLESHADLAVLQAALNALGEIGNPEAVNAIDRLLSARDVEIAPPAISALARIATPEAISAITRHLGRGPDIDSGVLESLTALADEVTIDILNVILSTGTASSRNYSKAKLVALGAKSVPALIANLRTENPDLQIHSLNALLAIGSESAVMPVRKLIASQPKNANVRFAAFEALAGLPVRKGDYIWASGLLDPEENIRLAAARAIERSMDDVLAAGVRNMVKHSDQEAAHVVKAVLDAQASRIFMNLVRHDVGLPLLVGYLTQHAHPEITRFFVQTLRDEGYLDLAGHIETHGSGKESKPRRKVCAVDDSRMFLSIYRSVLNELGFEAELFLEPEEALSWLAGHRPSLVCTDLNMPRMNGIDLTREIRKLYDKNELPVIMVTTQSDLRDQGDAYAAGVNVIAAKPFDGKSLQAAIASCAS